MKRYVIATQLPMDSNRAKIWYSKVKQAIDRTQLSNMIAKYKEDPDTNYPLIQIELADPYKCRYYSRWKEFLNWFEIAPNRDDYSSPGSPDMLVVLSENLSINAMVKKLEILYTKITELTERAQYTH